MARRRRLGPTYNRSKKLKLKKNYLGPIRGWNICYEILVDSLSGSQNFEKSNKVKYLKNGKKQHNFDKMLVPLCTAYGPILLPFVALNSPSPQI